MTMRSVTPAGWVADDQTKKITARFIDEEGRSYEVVWLGAAITEMLPPTAEVDQAVEPTTRRRGRHRLPGSWRPTLPAGLPTGPPGGDAVAAVVEPDPPDFDQEL